MDETAEVPVLETGSNTKNHYTECFLGSDGVVRHDYSSRLYKYKHDGNNNDMDNAISYKAFAGICPDFVLN